MGLSNSFLGLGFRGLRSRLRGLRFRVYGFGSVVYGPYEQLPIRSVLHWILLL